MWSSRVRAHSRASCRTSSTASTVSTTTAGRAILARSAGFRCAAFATSERRAAPLAGGKGSRSRFVKDGTRIFSCNFCGSDGPIIANDTVAFVRSRASWSFKHLPSALSRGPSTCDSFSFGVMEGRARSTICFNSALLLSIADTTWGSTSFDITVSDKYSTNCPKLAKRLAFTFSSGDAKAVTTTGLIFCWNSSAFMKRLPIFKRGARNLPTDPCLSFSCPFACPLPLPCCEPMPVMEMWLSSKRRGRRR
mmetsp:Transcript_30748/g.80423  ORF Transcript_30748/g.80423 Transcript_30748/m.80423 type:complete len:250 (-) Transcript_30748:1056-1805(-)